MTHKTLAIIGAMDCEIDSLKSILSDIKDHSHNGFEIWSGSINGHTVIVAKSGVGKVNSAITVQYIIDNFSPDYIINTGVAGGVADNLNVGDIVIATSLVQHDFDASALGYPVGYICNGIMSDKPTCFYGDTNLINMYENALKETELDVNIHKGVIASGDTFISSNTKKQQLKELFNATAAEMEGAAIAQTAEKNGIPFMVVRAISDLANNSAPQSLETAESKMAEFAAKTTKALLDRI